MFKIALLLTLGSSVSARLGSGDNCTNAAWAQCGGDGYGGETCCPAGYDCTYENDYYSGCSLEDLCLVVQYGQCGGVDADGQPWPEAQQCCPAGYECSFQSAYYSQCTMSGSNTTDCAIAYGQCGGEGFDGPTCCTDGYECTVDPVNPQYYSGCTPIPVCENAFYGQCGGVDTHGDPWTEKHTTCCPDGFDCEFESSYFSQCCPPEGCNAVSSSN